MTTEHGVHARGRICAPRILIAAAAFMLPTLTCPADVLTVDDDGPADFDNLQAAVDAAADGDEIRVSPGTYTSDHLGQVVDMKGKAVRLVSTAGAASTFIDGRGEHRGIICFDKEGPGTVIEGFTIRNGNCVEYDYDGNGALDVWDYCGGGMLNYWSNPTVLDCEFIDCRTRASGGAMYNHVSSPVVTRCTFRDNWAANSASRGGGMQNVGGSPVVTDCLFVDNEALFAGGGVSNMDVGTPEFVRCSFIDNRAGTLGGGMDNTTCTPEVTDCHFTGNSAGWWGGGMYNEWSSALVRTSVFQGNSAKEGGAAFNWDEGRPTFTGCEFLANSATEHGGAIHSDFQSALEVLDSTFHTNTAVISGGAISLHRAPATVSGSSFTENESNLGGAIAVAQTGTLFSYVCVYSFNHADEHGGAIYLDNATFAGANETYTGNWANRFGGAIESTNNATLQLQQSVFQGAPGIASQFGGAIDIDPSAGPASIDGCTISDCMALDSGGGIYAASFDTSIVNCRIHWNHAPSGGGVFSATMDTYIRFSAICDNTNDQVFHTYEDGGFNSIGEDCCQGDVNQDGVIDGADLTLMLGAWGVCEDLSDCPADVNGDFVVDGADMTIVLGGWGPCL